MTLILLQTLESGASWEADLNFWSGKLESLPPGSRFIEARAVDPSLPYPGEGVLLARALENAGLPRVLIVPAGPEWRFADLPARLSAKIDHAHMVVLARPVAMRSLPARLLHGLLRGALRVLLAIDIGPVPGWPGWRRWSERMLGWWFLGLRGSDPCSPCRMIRLEVVRQAAIQSRGSLVHAELSAKANFLGALIDEEPWTLGAAVPSTVRDSRWWEDFRELFHHPRFTGALFHQPEVGVGEPVGVP